MSPTLRRRKDVTGMKCRQLPHQRWSLVYACMPIPSFFKRKKPNLYFQSLQQPSPVFPNAHHSLHIYPHKHPQEVKLGGHQASYSFKGAGLVHRKVWSHTRRCCQSLERWSQSPAPRTSFLLVSCPKPNRSIRFLLFSPNRCSLFQF